jgi:hypothetical protein
VGRDVTGAIFGCARGPRSGRRGQLLPLDGTGGGGAGKGGAGPSGPSSSCRSGGAATTAGAGALRMVEGTSGFGSRRLTISSTSFLLRRRASCRTARWFSRFRTGRSKRTVVAFSDPSASQPRMTG